MFAVSACMSVHAHYSKQALFYYYSLNVQVPLSALSAPLAVPGNVGGPFNSTTKFKAVPLPAMYSHHQLSNRGIRSVGLHTPRYVPTITSKIRTVSDSLINLTQSGDKQKEHLFNSENNVLFSRKLQREREITPHRVEGSYYMNGLSAQLFNRDDIPQNELDVLQKMALSQNTHLYYGKGIRSVSGKTAKLVKQFENRLKNCISAQNGKLNYALEDIDAGRYSRTSRAVTPGSPLIEEPEQEKNEEAVESSPSNDTFMTQQNNQ